MRHAPLSRSTLSRPEVCPCCPDRQEQTEVIGGIILRPGYGRDALLCHWAARALFGGESATIVGGQAHVCLASSAPDVPLSAWSLVSWSTPASDTIQQHNLGKCAERDHLSVLRRCTDGIRWPRLRYDVIEHGYPRRSRRLARVGVAPTDSRTQASRLPKSSASCFWSSTLVRGTLAAPSYCLDSH